MKTCEIEGCNRGVWKANKCLLHTPKLPIKKSNKPLKKGNNKLKKGGKIKPISEKGKVKKALKTERTKEIHQAMYNWWLKQEKNQCMSCGCNLPSEFHTWMVDHLLEKSQYPEFALEEYNFYLTCFDDHSAKTNGFPHPTHKAAIKNAKYWLIERKKD